MSYTVLARKWRPKNFSELVGQQHVMQALSNALDQQRLHHAYLFTGTRGVGKTTIARIFSKALNCEQGISSKPCGKCAACKSIDEGRFVDLIEVDAASRTKVEDTRELLENVQYSPVQGRYKVYLIDEVHMLSKSSFNALLKTLEEPPEHVKFLLATTDPHKLPVTVLSRCLQFNLMRLTQSQIQNHLSFILQQEQIEFEEAALAMIAKSADGSARDSLSILDQAIAYGGGQVYSDAVKEMLGLVDQQYVVSILSALINDSAGELKAIIGQVAAMGVNYEALNAQLIEALHQMTMIQVLGDLTEIAVIDQAFLQQAAQILSPEKIQIMYQIALLASQDMSLAPDIRIGFEMSLLRMLAFEPSTNSQSAEMGLSDSNQVSGPQTHEEKKSRPSQTTAISDPSLNTFEPAVEVIQQPTKSVLTAENSNNSGNDHLANLKEKLDFTLGKPDNEASQSKPTLQQEHVSEINSLGQQADVSSHDSLTGSEWIEEKPETEIIRKPIQNGSETFKNTDGGSSESLPDISAWLSIIQSLGLEGMAAELARQSVLVAQTESTLSLSVDPFELSAKTDLALQRLEERIRSQLGLRTIFVEHKGEHHTPSKYWQNQKRIQKVDAEQQIYQDPIVQALMDQLKMRVIEKTIESIN